MFEELEKKYLEVNRLIKKESEDDIKRIKLILIKRMLKIQIVREEKKILFINLFLKIYLLFEKNKLNINFNVI